MKEIAAFVLVTLVCVGLFYAGVCGLLNMFESHGRRMFKSRKK